MKDQHDKSWNDLRDRLQTDLPQEYSTSDWQEMNELLNNTPSTPFKFPKLFVGIVLVLGLGISTWMLYPANANHSVERSNQESIDQSDVPSITAITSAEKSSAQTATSSTMDSDKVLSTNSKWNTTTLQNQNERTNNRSKSTNTNTTASKNALANPPSFNEYVLAGTDRTTSSSQASSSQVLSSAPTTSTTTDFMQKGIQVSTKSSTEIVDEIGIEKAVLERQKVETLAFLTPLNFSVNYDRNTPNLNTPINPFKAKRRSLDYGFFFGSNTTFTDTQDNKPLSIRPLLGIFGTVRINSKWSVQAEISHKQIRNYDQTYVITDTMYIDPINFTTLNVYENTLTGFNFIDFSLLAKYNTRSPFSFLIGGRFSTMIAEYGSGIIRGGFNEVSNEYWRTSYAFTLGTNIRLSPRWSLDMRYSQGLLDMTPDNLYRERVNHLNSDLQVSFRFHL